MRCNWRRWFWGLIPLALLAWAALETERGAIERDLADRAREALAQSGQSWVQVSFDGRDARLTGQTAEDGERALAQDALSGLWGVRTIDNQTALTPKLERYNWSASRRNNRIRLSGHVPNRATRQILIGMAKANFPGFEIADRMTVARGVPEQDTWLSGVNFALKMLMSLKRGDVRLENLGLSVTGQAEDLAGYRATKTALSANLPKGISLQNEQVTAPVVSPYTWTAQWNGNQLTLGGHYPSDSARSELIAKATDSGTIADLMQPGEGAPQGWLGAAHASIAALIRLENGSAELKDAMLIFAGVASDETQAESVRNDLRAAMPAAIKLTEQIQAKERPEPPVKTEAPAAKAADASPAPAARLGVAEGRPGEPSPAKMEAPQPAAPAQQAALEPDRNAAPPASDAKQDTGQAETKAAAPLEQQGEKQAAVAPPVEQQSSTTLLATQTLPDGRRGPDDGPAKQVMLQAPAAEPKAAASADDKSRACVQQITEIAKSDAILFDSDSAEISSDDYAVLDKLVALAKTCPDVRIAVEGHADAEGTSGYNDRLSLRRAHSVISYFTKAGLEPTRLEAIAHGNKRPLVPNNTPENKAKNRRIEFTVQPR
jgi:OOP family OmpA-OmpF porin